MYGCLFVYIIVTVTVSLLEIAVKLLLYFLHLSDIHLECTIVHTDTFHFLTSVCCLLMGHVKNDGRCDVNNI